MTTTLRSIQLPGSTCISISILFIETFTTTFNNEFGAVAINTVVKILFGDVAEALDVLELEYNDGFLTFPTHNFTCSGTISWVFCSIIKETFHCFKREKYIYIP